VKRRVIYSSSWKTCKKYHLPNFSFKNRVLCHNSEIVLTGHNSLTVIAKTEIWRAKTRQSSICQKIIWTISHKYNSIYQISKFRYVSVRFLEQVTSKQHFRIIIQFHVRTIMCVLPWDTYGQLFPTFASQS